MFIMPGATFDLIQSFHHAKIISLLFKNKSICCPVPICVQGSNILETAQALSPLACQLPPEATGYRRSGQVTLRWSSLGPTPKLSPLSPPGSQNHSEGRPTGA